MCLPNPWLAILTFCYCGSNHPPVVTLVAHPRISSVAHKSAKMGGGQQGHTENAKMEQGDFTPTPAHTFIITPPRKTSLQPENSRIWWWRIEMVPLSNACDAEKTDLDHDGELGDSGAGLLRHRNEHDPVRWGHFPQFHFGRDGGNPWIWLQHCRYGFLGT